MSKKSGILAASAIVFLIIAGGTGFYFFNKASNSRELQNKMELIESYSSSNQFDKALELIDELKIKFKNNTELDELASYITEKKSEYEARLKENREYREKIIEASENLIDNSILDEFVRLKNELLRLEPGSELVKAAMQNIDKSKENLLEKVDVLLKSLFNASTEEEAQAIKKVIYDLLDEEEIEFQRDQIKFSNDIKDQILAIDPDNRVAKELEKVLREKEKELETQEERAAFKKKIDDMLTRTRELIAENKFQEAEALRNKILQEDPENIEADDLKSVIEKREAEKKLDDEVSRILENAEMALEQNMFERAEKLRKDALKLDPNNQQAINMKSRIENREEDQFNRHVDDIVKKSLNAIDKGQLDYAEDLRQQVAQLDPSNPDVKALKEKIEAKKRALADKAEQERVAEIERLVKEASLKMKNNNLLESEELFNKVILLDSNNIDALKGLADISLKNSEKDSSEIPRSIRRVLRVLDEEPDNINYLKELVDLYDRSSDFENEISALTKLLRLDPSAASYVKAGIASFKLTKYKAAAGYFESAISMDSNYPEIYYPYALTYEKLGDNSSRESMLQKSVSLRPNHAATFYELGRLYTDEKKYNDALELFLKANSINSDGIKFKMGVALAYYNLGEFDKAIEIYEKILAIDKTLSEVYYNLSLSKMAVGDYNTALTDISLAIKLKPNSPSYIYTIGQISEALGKDDNAMTYYMTAIKMDNTFYKPMLNLGNIYDKTGRYADGLTILKMAYSINPDDEGVRFSLGTSYLHNKMYEESIVLLEEAYNKDPGSLLKLYTLSLAYTEVGENGKAEEGFLTVLESDSGYFDAYFYLGQLLYSLNRQDEAKTYFNNLLELNPEYKFKDKIMEMLQ